MELEGKIFNLAKEKNYIGAANDLDVLFAKEIYLSTQKEIVSNKINVIVSVLGLYKAVGGVDLYNWGENI